MRNARPRHPHRLQRLKTRLFFWFFGAIVLAIASSSLVVHFTRPDQSEGPVRVVSRTVAGHLARDWDDPRACDAYVARLKEQLGLDLRVVREPSALPPHVKRAVGRNAPVAFARDGHAYIPVVRDGQIIGAAAFDVGPPPPSHWVRLGAALGVALLVLGLAAVRVSRQLARPLEQVAVAAERFGAGDLAARTALGGPRRWVASEVAEVGGAFDRMAERIEGVVRDQRELLAAISHEIRSPLGRARVALEIARDKGREPLPPALLDDVERPLHEVDAILGDLLAAARAGLSDLRTEKTRLLPWLRARAAAEPVPPVVEIVAPDAAEDIELTVDSALLGRAVHNLLVNARVHGHPADQPLELRVEVDAAKVRVVVRDRGPGFPTDLLPRVFEPFVRGDAARSPGSGTGLGLALVRRIADAHGGRAFARNAEASPDVVSPDAASPDAARAAPPARVPGSSSVAGGAEVGIELPRVPAK